MRFASIQCSKCDCGRDPLRTPLGELTALSQTRSLAGFKGSRGEGKVGRRREGRERERAERDREGGEGRLILMCSWNRAADWLRCSECNRHRTSTFNKKAQLSLTNPRDACETFAGFT